VRFALFPARFAHQFGGSPYRRAVTPAVRPAVKGFVVAFLAAFLVCGLVGLEVFPFTGWRLFSRVRTEHVAGWQAVAVDATGAERDVPFGDLPAAYRSWTHVASGLAALPEAERQAVCRAWAAGAASRGVAVAEVRVYATWESLAVPGSFRRELRHTCRP
jgi:hypothetical protein